MKPKFLAVALVAAAFASAPLGEAQAGTYYSSGARYDDSALFFGLFAAGVTGAALALAATNPSPVVVSTYAPPARVVYVAPPPARVVYAAPAPVHYVYKSAPPARYERVSHRRSMPQAYQYKAHHRHR